MLHSFCTKEEIDFELLESSLSEVVDGERHIGDVVGFCFIRTASDSLIIALSFFNNLSQVFHRMNIVVYCSA